MDARRSFKIDQFVANNGGIRLTPKALTLYCAEYDSHCDAVYKVCGMEFADSILLMGQLSPQTLRGE